MTVNKAKKSKRTSADRRWTLLFIGDHGNVVTLKHFKAIVIGAGLLFCLAFVLVALLFFQNVGTLKENKILQNRFADSEKQVEKLRHEKEILMARLVLAEAKTKETISGDQQTQEKMKVAEPAAPLPEAAPKPEPAKPEQKKPPVPQATRPKPKPEPESELEPELAETDEAEPVISVAVANFKISLGSDSQNLNAEFKIRNTSPEPQQVDGYAVVVLKAEDLQKDQWLVMPAVGLAGEKPSGKRGNSFSIQRFRTMNFTSKAPDYSDQFETASVYVFAKTGEMLLEQDFPITLPPVSVVSSQRLSTPAVSDEPPASQSSGNEAPADELPEIDFTLDSLKNAPPVF